LNRLRGSIHVRKLGDLLRFSSNNTKWVGGAYGTYDTTCYLRGRNRTCEVQFEC
jgi:hypothetical protein